MPKINIQPMPFMTSSSYRYFHENEKHITRIFKEYVLIFVLDSTLFFSENGKDVKVGTGEWYLQKPNLLQEGKVGSPAPKYYYIHFEDFPPQHSREFPFSKSAPVTVGTRGKFSADDFVPYFERLESIKKFSPWDKMTQQSIFLSILAKISKPENKYIHKSSDLANSVAEYLNNEFCFIRSISEIGKHFGYSSDYITKAMKKYYKTTPWQYVVQLRISTAQNLLKTTNLNISEIAEAVGYNDTVLLYKAFKSKTGMSPAEWRKKK